MHLYCIVLEVHRAALIINMNRVLFRSKYFDTSITCQSRFSLPTLLNSRTALFLYSFSIFFRNGRRAGRIGSDECATSRRAFRDPPPSVPLPLICEIKFFCGFDGAAPATVIACHSRFIPSSPITICNSLCGGGDGGAAANDAAGRCR